MTADNNARDATVVGSSGTIDFQWHEGKFRITIRTITDATVAELGDDKLDQMLRCIAEYRKVFPTDPENPYAKNVAAAALANRGPVASEPVDPLEVSRSMDAMFTADAIAIREAMVDEIVGPEHRAMLQRIKNRETPEEHAARAKAKRTEIEQRNRGGWPDNTISVIAG